MMGKKTKRNVLKTINNSNVVIIKTKNDIYFEIGNKITNDIAEAVAILIREKSVDDPIWKTSIQHEYDHVIRPRRSLFWLTGGYKEWNQLDNYKFSWHECYEEFNEAFGDKIINIVNNSETLNDIRKKFLEELNLPILYDFAISKNIIR